ncbi:MAG: type II toxin-antitoxin system VapC family toxin [Candidatus Bathyarchaeia archaeon]
MERYCLDTYAVLALIGGEAGAEVVEKALVEARESRAEVYMSTVSLGELYNVISREKGFEVANRKYAELKMTKIIFDAPDEETAIQAGRFKTKYSRAEATFALADAFCLATAHKHQAKIVAGDPEFSPVTECEVVWVTAPTT